MSRALLLLRRRRAAAPFVPTSISGLMAWYKADAGTFQDSAGSTPATADSDPIGRWADQSGNARHITQTTSTKRPLLKTAISGGYPAVRTDGVDDWLSGSWSNVAQPITIVFCGIPRGSMDDADVLIDGLDSTHRTAMFINSGNYASFYGGSAVVNTTYKYGVNRAHMPYAVFNGASSKHSLAPDMLGASGSVGTQGSDGLWVGTEFGGGNPRHVNVDFLEILVYNAALTQAQLESVQSYFRTRYAIKRPAPVGTNPIIANGGGGWKNSDVANPDVFRDTPNNRWVMNFSGYSGTVWKTGLAYSTDLLTWTEEAANPVFSPNGSEGNIAANGSIVLKGSTYYLYYQAGLASGNQICCATSPDLLTWTRQNSGNPVIAVDATDLTATADPYARLMPDGITIEVYYLTNSGGSRRIRRATSTDGIAFTKVATGTFLLTGVNDQTTFGEPYPIGDYGSSMQLLTDWAIGTGVQARRTLLWTTADGGATWTCNGVFLAPNPNLSWQSAQIFDTCAVVSGGTMYLFYAGATVNGAAAGLNAQIGVMTQVYP